jgi:hypothetical protein
LEYYLLDYEHRIVRQVVTSVSEKPVASISNCPENDSRNFLRNVGNALLDYTIP